MKNLSDFKRELKIDTVWEVKSFGKTRIQKVVKIRSNSIVWSIKIEEEFLGYSYLYFPKATEFQINSQGEAEIWFKEDILNNCPTRLAVTYRKINDII